MIRHTLCLGAAAILGCSVHLAAHAGDLRAGVGKVSITPTADEFPYTVVGERSFVGVHDDVYARALVLDDGKRRVALVLLEVNKVQRPDELRKAVALEIGMPESDAMVAASHTHEVPLIFYHGGQPNPTQAKEIARLKQATVEAVRQAKANLQPARIAFGRGQGWVNINNGEQAGLMEAYDPSGPSDKTLDVLRLDTPQGSPIAMLVNYASHGELMYRSVTRDGGYEVSGDLPGAVSRILESLPGAAPVVLYSGAAEADQLPLFKSLQPAGRLPAADEGAAGWGLLDAQARRLARSVMDVVAGMQLGKTQARIDAAVGTTVCPGQQLSQDPQTHQVTAEDRPPVTIPLSIIRINNIVLAGVGGDVASAIGRHFKAASPVADSTLISMTGDAVSYVLADASYKHPGHGLMRSPLRPHCAEDAIVGGLIHLINSAH